MITVRYGGKRGKSVPLAVSKDLMVVRTRDGRTVDRSVRTESDAAAFSGFHSVARFEDAGVEVFRVPGKGREALGDEAFDAELALPALDEIGRFSTLEENVLEAPPLPEAWHGLLEACGVAQSAGA